MDSITAPPSSASCPASGQEGDAALTLTLVARLAEPAGRMDGARALARHLGADDLVIFTPDPDLSVSLPAPGFPQTLPQASRWHAFVAACAAEGDLCVGELPGLGADALVPALGLSAGDGAVLVLLGGTATPGGARLATLRVLLPILTALCRHERAEATAQGQARMAREVAAQARALASALDGARYDLQQALRETETARQRLDLLNAVSALLAASLEDERSLAGVAALLTPALADVCLIDVVEETATDGRSRGLRRVAAAPAAMAEAGHSRHDEPLLLLDEAHPIARTARTGEALVLTDMPADAARSLLGTVPIAGGSEPACGVRVHAGVIVPLVARGQIVGALSLLATSPGRGYGPDEVALADDIAGRCALAIENGRLYRHVQQAVRTRDEFLLAASHDLKTPLTAIQGQAQLLGRRAARAGWPAIPWLDTGVAQIQHSTRAMLTLLDELLDVTRVQLGQALQLERQPVDLVALARQVAASQQQTTQRHRLSVETREAALVGRWDATRLTRLLENLLTNAIKYSPAGGAITVTIERDGGAGVAHARWAVLTVRDQGVGIPAGDIPHIFDRFQRGSNVIGRIAGTGVGLASVRYIVEQHGGSISVVSQEAQGSTFVVRLPLAEPSDQPATQR